jgi:hypothetical protein
MSEQAVVGISDVEKVSLMAIGRPASGRASVGFGSGSADPVGANESCLLEQ